MRRSLLATHEHKRPYYRKGMAVCCAFMFLVTLLVSSLRLCVSPLLLFPTNQLNLATDETDATASWSARTDAATRCTGSSTPKRRDSSTAAGRSTTAGLRRGRRLRSVWRGRLRRGERGWRARRRRRRRGGGTSSERPSWLGGLSRSRWRRTRGRCENDCICFCAILMDETLCTRMYTNGTKQRM